MDQRLASTWRMTVNERKFILEALEKGLRVDGRGLLDYRQLSIQFGREDGSVEVHLGQTHVMGYVTSQLVRPYRDRPNEGTLSIFTEFSPMADPSFEVGRPGESAIELGRIIDRGLRESRAVDMESLSIIAGKYVWAIRVDLHILDNCGNLIDAANIAALAALLTFRRPECTVTGEDSQEVLVHPLEAREPLPLVIHHIPVAVTFAIFSEGDIMVIDPTHSEEAVMGGRMTITMNTNGEICAIQKGGGEGVTPSTIIDCLRIASIKTSDITSKIKNAVELYDNERTLRKVRRHSSAPVVEVNIKDVSMTGNNMDEVPRHHIEKSRNDLKISAKNDASRQGVKSFTGGPSSWDPYPKGLVSDVLRNTLSHGSSTFQNENVAENVEKTKKAHPEKSIINAAADNCTPVETPSVSQQSSGPKSLRDAVKPKNRRKKKTAAANDDK